MTDFHYMSLAEAGALIRRGDISPVDYANALLERIEAIDGGLDAFLEVAKDQALADAKAAETEIAAGEWRGPMHGIPYGLKDIIDYAGLRTTAHSKILEDNVAGRDATVTAKLKDAGAVFLGKTSTHEFALGGPSFDLPWPPARNPWNRGRHPGGSSSGSGAAVASGMLPAALGSDTGGSVRHPASMCGIVGMKPTYGRVSRAGVVPLSFSLDNVGPMTRTVEDNAILLGAICGHDGRDPASARAHVPDFTEGIGQGVEGLRIGHLRHFYTTDMEAEPDMAAAIDDAAERFAALGAVVEEVELEPLSDYAGVNRVILTSEAYAVHEQWLKQRPGDYAHFTRERLLPGAFMRAADYIQALRHRERMKNAYAELMRDYHVLLTASSMQTACAIDDEAAIERTYARQARTPFNVVGGPALVVPAGFAQDGLPLSIQLAGRAFDEAMLYRVGHALEQATDWRHRHPPVD
ncbi:MAG: amidase [Alphaproteobacteria bacterium]|jgi:aspartyl-tRNA(Asn)/glutamyl-tRNA(Gln) amidotransferase subunit A|nr:amidase [Alphaproteobacteria bacterium]